MKNALPIFALLLALAAGGCSTSSSPTTKRAASPTAAKSSAAANAPTAPIVTPDLSLSAQVVKVNNVGRFVILGFPAGQLPRADQTLFLYREGLKVAEVHTTSQQLDNNVVADLVSGTAQVGDAVSDK